jgi:phosphatidylglycerol lysyltransferase
MPVPSVRWLRLLGPLLFVAALGLAARELRDVEPAAVVAALRALSPARWALALTATAASFAALAGYEWLAVRSLGLAVPTRTVVSTGLIGWAVGQALGPAWLSGGAVRWRLYGRAGLTKAQVGQIVATNLATFWASLVLLLGAALAIDPPAQVGAFGRPVGLGLLVLVAGVFALVARGRAVTVGRFTVHLPAPRLLAAQLAVGVVDNVAAVFALAACLPALPVSLPSLVVLFAGANVAGLLSGVPGGLGTLDGGLVALLSPAVPAGAVLAGVLAWRVVYAFVPLALALVGLGAAELAARPDLRDLAGRGVRAVAAPAFAGIAFLAGSGLLVSTFAPGAPGPARWLGAPLPDEVLAASHAASAVVGVGLWFVARGLWARTREAWFAFVALLLAGALASLGRGVDADGLVALGLVLAALPARGAFWRRAALGREVWPAAHWLGVAVAGLVAAVALGSALVDVHAPGHLRVAAVVAAAAAAGVLGSGLRPVRRAPPAPTEADLAAAVAIARDAHVSSGWLAATGDKALLFDADRQAFLMYGVHRDRWIAFTGPVGPPERWPALLDDFRARARRAGAKIALYEVPAAHLPLCTELGLRTYKFGEEARVPLADFTVEGGAHKNRRALLNKLDREGCTFEVVPAEQVADVLPGLRAVSDAWLAEKGSREKGFSLGRFDEAWLQRAPVAVVRVAGRPVAFANLLVAGDELSIDLMRFHPDAPKGTMDFLFLRLLQHGKASGFATFVLGMAPLSGLSTAPGAPAWSRAGGLVFSHGERFYNFRGLRSYKEKYHPDWAPRYLAVEGRLGPWSTLGSVWSLVGAPWTRAPGRARAG